MKLAHGIRFPLVLLGVPTLLVPLAQAQSGKSKAGSVATHAEPTAINATAQANGPGKPLVHFWSKVVGAGRANEGLRSTWQEELETAVKNDGFQYVRFHGLFHDDMFVYREDGQGHPIYNFQYIDDLFDRMLAKNARPFVELGFVPKELAIVQNTTFWWQANGSPPSDYNKWAALVQATELTKCARGTSRCGMSQTSISRSFAAHSNSISSCTRSHLRP